MTRIYLIRHAEAEGNLYRRVHGVYDSLVTETGEKQIEALADRFRNEKIDAVYASDRYRTGRTAQAICRVHDLPLQIDQGLREINMGTWEDVPWGELNLFEKERMALFSSTSPDFQADDGETFEQVRRRMKASLERIAAEHPNQTVAVFSHGMSIRNALAVYMGLTVAESAHLPHSDNTAVSLLEFDDNGKVKIVYADDNSHLPLELSTFGRQKWWRKGKSSADDSNLWYRPLDPVKEPALYLSARREAWETARGTMTECAEAELLDRVRRQCAQDPRSLYAVMLEKKAAGILQLDLQRGADRQTGRIDFLYLFPEYRNHGLGVQIMGQAISVYRPMGRRALQILCARDNAAAQRFCARYSFRKVGEEPGTFAPLDLLEKDISWGKLP